MSINQRNQTIFYGWFIVAACFAVTLTLGETFWSFGVFFKPLENEFGWSRTLVSSGYTAFLIGHAISLVASGGLVDRYSPRPILLASALIAGAGISLCSQIHSVSQFRIYLFIAGLGAGPTWSVPNSTVQRWFHDRRRAGLALAIVTAGVGIGALVFAPLINHFILTYGWRNAFLYVGIIFFLIISVSALMIRQSPAEAERVLAGEGNVTKPRQEWRTSRVVTTSSFIGISFIVLIAVVAFQTLSVHLVPHATDVGISATSSAAALGLIGGFSIPGRILSGLFSETLGWRKTLGFSLFGMALSTIWLLFLDGTWMLYCFVFSYGMCHGVRIPAQLGILSQFFGMGSLGQLIGITSAIGQLVGALAPYIAGFIFDTTGSYFIAFLIVMALLSSGGLVATVMKEQSIASK